MSIKGAIKRLEGVLVRNNGSQVRSFMIPYCRDKNQANQIQQQIILNEGIGDQKDVLRIFVIDFAL